MDKILYIHQVNLQFERCITEMSIHKGFDTLLYNLCVKSGHSIYLPLFCTSS